MRAWVVIDYETRSARDIDAGTDEYFAHASTEALCVAWQFPDRPVQVVEIVDNVPVTSEGFAELAAHVAAGGTVVAHKADFELLAWAMLHKRRPDVWPQLRPEQTHCTMAMGMACALPGSLDNLAKAMNLPMRKDEEGYALMRKMSSPRKATSDEVRELADELARRRGYVPTSRAKTKQHEHFDKLAALEHFAKTVMWHDGPDLRARLMEYCKVDVEVQTLAWLALPKLPERERRLWLLDYRINRRGIGIDREACHAAQIFLERAAVDLDAELHALTGGAVPSANARDKLRTWLADQGVHLADMTKTTVENAVKVATGKAKRALEIRQIVSRSSTAKLAPMLDMTTENGRARGTLTYHRATTGRWASSGIQTQNLPRTPKGWKVKDAESAIREIKRYALTT